MDIQYINSLAVEWVLRWSVRWAVENKDATVLRSAVSYHSPRFGLSGAFACQGLYSRTRKEIF